MSQYNKIGGIAFRATLIQKLADKHTGQLDCIKKQRKPLSSRCQETNKTDSFHSCHEQHISSCFALFRLCNSQSQLFAFLFYLVLFIVHIYLLIKKNKKHLSIHPCLEYDVLKKQNTILVS